MEEISGSIYILHANSIQTKGFKVGGHLHPHDHTTVFWGRWLMRKFGVEWDAKTQKPVIGGARFLIHEEIIDSRGPRPWRLIDAKCYHDLELLSDTGQYGCFHSHYNKKGQVVPVFEGERQHV